MKKTIVFLLATSITTSALAFTDARCPGEDGYSFTNYKKRNPQVGGFVSSQADVVDDDDVFIAPTAAICGSSSVRGGARIYGNAIVKDSEVYDRARIYGNAVVTDSEVFGEARISDNVKLTNSVVSGSVYLQGWYKGTNVTLNSGNYSAEKPVQPSKYTAAERDSFFKEKWGNLRHEIESTYLSNKFKGSYGRHSSDDLRLSGITPVDNLACKLRFTKLVNGDISCNYHPSYDERYSSRSDVCMTSEEFVIDLSRPDLTISLSESDLSLSYTTNEVVGHETKHYPSNYEDARSDSKSNLRTLNIEGVTSTTYNNLKRIQYYCTP